MKHFLFGALALAALSVAAEAQIATVPPGPVSTFQVNPYNRTTQSFSNTAGKTSVSCAPVGGEKTGVFITPGQSLSANGNGSTFYTPTNATKVQQLNILDGNCYQLVGPSLGATDTSDIIWSRLGDALINAGTFQRVIFVTIAQSATTSYDWSKGIHYSRLQVAMSWLRVKGLTLTAVLVQQGQGDCAGGSPDGNTTSSAVYQANWQRAQSIVDSYAQVPWLFAVDTMISSATNATIQGAQAALVNNGARRYAGPNIDGLTVAGGNRLVDNTHLSNTGLDAASALWKTSIDALNF